MQPPPTVATVRPVTAEVPLFQPGDQIPGESGMKVSTSLQSSAIEWNYSHVKL